MVYLGTFPVERVGSIYENWSPSDWAMSFIQRYGQIDGEHHKLWVLDQVAQILLGSPVFVVEARWDDSPAEHRVSVGDPSAQYLEWKTEMQGGGYSYDAGIAP